MMVENTDCAHTKYLNMYIIDSIYKSPIGRDIYGDMDTGTWAVAISTNNNHY
jgi:hypothetical protein